MTRYIGVWGRKNCQRFRRFMRERGAEIRLMHERPHRLRRGVYVTHPRRTKVRSLEQPGPARKGAEPSRPLPVNDEGQLSLSKSLSASADMT